VADPPSPHRSDEDLLAVGGVETFEALVDTMAGPRDMLVSKATVCDADGETIGLVGSLTDISVVREAERRSRLAAQAERAANDAKTEFVANMSHELRTPLQSIIGFSEIGLLRGPESALAQKCFQQVHDAGRHMLSLVEDLLDLSRSDLVTDRAEHTLQLLGPMVAEVLDGLAPQAAQKGIEWTCQGLDSDVHARVEPRGFQQVVRNVAANALRFSPMAGRIELALETQGEWVHLRISDRGPGIPPDELEAVFEPFVQSTRTKTQAGGTGLGLAICRRIMQAHQGGIWAEARSGGGSTFVIALPREP
jgi:signal transduction histidine kinase